MAKGEKIEFPEPQSSNVVTAHDGQGHGPVGTRKYTRQDGREIDLLVWTTFRAECGAPFEATTCLSFARLSRRCAEHRHREKTVNGRHRFVRATRNGDARA